MDKYEMQRIARRERYLRAKEAGTVNRLSEDAQRRVTAVLGRVNQDKLNEHIVMPDWERRLLPLFLFRGTKPYRIRADWNAIYGMFLTECEDLTIGAHAFGPTDVGHICGLHSAPQHKFRSILDRLRACPDVTNSVSKAFTEYVEWLRPRPFTLQTVPLRAASYEEGKVGWWRLPPEKKVKLWKPSTERAQDIPYPYVRTIRSAEHQLLMDVHAKLPKGLPHEIRGDLCQDLIVAVLSGETNVDNIPDVVMSYARQAKKILPDRWKTISLDDLVFSDGDDKLSDRMTGEITDDHICGPSCGHGHDDELAILEGLDR